MTISAPYAAKKQTQSRSSISNIVNSPSGIAAVLELCKDRKTFIGTDNNYSLWYCTNLDSGSAPVWTKFSTLPNSSYPVVQGCFEADDGHLLVCSRYNGGPFRVYRSNEVWDSSNPTAALTWAVVQNGIGGNGIGNGYSFHLGCFDADGTVIVAEQGAQTGSAVANQASDPVSAARRVWRSQNFGAAWDATPIFDIYTYGQSIGVAYPANVHIHGVAYVKDWDGYMINFGDDNGDGLTIANKTAGAFAETVFVDKTTLAVTKIPLGPEGDAAAAAAPTAPTATRQSITIINTPKSILFTSDTGNASGFALVKTGYRTFGYPKELPLQRSFGLDGRPYRNRGAGSWPTFVCGRDTTSSATRTTALRVHAIEVPPDGLNIRNLPIDMPAPGSTVTGMGITSIFGPTLLNKLVMLGRMDATNNMLLADYSAAP